MAKKKDTPKKKLAAIPPGKKTGLIPRDYKSHPSGYQACAPAAPDDWLVPENEWEERLKEQQAEKRSLWDLREANYEVLQSLDQDGLGLCWAFSTTKAVMYVRVLMGLPPLRLSAWWLAGVIKGWRDQGGWAAESLERSAVDGIPAESYCPSYKSSYDNAETRANAKLHRTTEWYDGSEDRDRNRAIMVSSFLLTLPNMLDYNHISHSMAGCRLVSVKPKLIVDTDNSWAPSYGNKGCMRLEGAKAIPDGVVVARVSTPSTV